MTVVRNHLIGGRFLERGGQRVLDVDEQEVERALTEWYELKTWHREWRWGSGIEWKTRAPVLIEGGRGSHCWAEDLEREATARRGSSLGSPYLVRVLHVGPGVVWAEPPPGSPRGTFSAEEAAELALQACETAASLHAAGVGNHLCFDARNLRVTGPDESRRIAWLVPSASPLETLADAARPAALREAGDAARRGGPIRRALWGIVDFFADLLPAGTLERAKDGSLLALSVMRRDPAGLPADVATLASLLVPLLAPSPSLPARIAAIPSVPVLPPILLDWDTIIAAGEAMLPAGDAEALRPGQGYIELPLAAAYHQRAGRRWASGAHAAALADVERAAELDGASLSIATTRAVLLDTLGECAKAMAVIAAALDTPPPPPDPWDEPQVTSPTALTRALGTRGMIALRAGAPAEAERYLRGALDGTPPAREAALYAHALGAARYARGDFAGAADAEARSVALEPENNSYRWALVGSLRKLGRHQEAREHAEAILAREPKAAGHLERFARLFG